ncbi:MAG: ABC transporter permease, partial [Cellulosilyticum sp.]|nr:ABC transporter permease [Cellulosilyticum sp.]
MKRQIGKRGIVLMVLILFQCLKIMMLQDFKEAYPTSRLAFYPKEATHYEQFVFMEAPKESPRVYLGSQFYKIEGKKEVEVKGLGVSHTYSLYEKLHLLKGNFWGEQAEKEARQVVVVSKTLAAKLFNTYEVLGETLQLEGQSYQIIGVYEKPQHLIEALVDDGEEVIYFPITSTLGKGQNIKEIWFSSEADKRLLALGEGTTYEATDAVKRLESIRDFGLSGIPSEVLPPYNIFDISYYWKYFKEQMQVHQKMLKLSETTFEATYWLVT